MKKSKQEKQRKLLVQSGIKSARERSKRAWKKQRKSNCRKLGNKQKSQKQIHNNKKGS